jgi:kumamolisin
VTAAFGTTLALYRHPDGVTYRAYTGPITLPAEVAPSVTGVFGLDERPQARTFFRTLANPTVSYTPPQVAKAYQFPPGASGTGQCVALIELGGGYRDADIAAYFSSIGVMPPTVVAVPVGGGVNQPGTADGPDGEVMLDIEVVGGVAPGVTIAVYFAPNTDQGFIDAVAAAVHDSTHHPSVVSISWGGPESTWTPAAITQMEQVFVAAASMGVTVAAAAGDNGSTDGVTDGLQHVDFPSSAPHALGCGGTRLTLASDGSWSAEVVWNGLPDRGATGGGISDTFDVPSYQRTTGVPPSANPNTRVGRGVPDVAGVADPETGYTVRVDGQTTTVGGTSAVAPLWAGVIAVVNQARGRPTGFLHPTLYASSTGGIFTDIVSGKNGAYSAGPGWDPCTGLGSPLVGALLRALP